MRDNNRLRFEDMIAIVFFSWDFAAALGVTGRAGPAVSAFLPA
jgi:hypothetical protein